MPRPSLDEIYVHVSSDPCIIRPLDDDFLAFVHVNTGGGDDWILSLPS